MRRMNAQSLAEARQLQQEQLVQQLSTWSMADTLPPAPGAMDGSAASQPPDRHAGPAMQEHKRISTSYAHVSDPFQAILITCL